MLQAINTFCPVLQAINTFCLVLGWIVFGFLLIMLVIGLLGFLVDMLRGDDPNDGP